MSIGRRDGFLDRLEKLQQELQDEKNSRERLMGQNKSLARQYVALKQHLAAANARAEQADAQNKRMQTAINRYVIGNIELLDALKAALEEKP